MQGGVVVQQQETGGFLHGLHGEKEFEKKCLTNPDYEIKTINKYNTVLLIRIRDPVPFGQFFGLKYLNSVMRIRDGIRHKHPGYATLIKCTSYTARDP